MLRDYQKKAISDLWKCIKKHPNCNPLIVLPTGAGKSHVISNLIEMTKKKFPHLRVVVVTHRKELILQNSTKFATNVGLYGAGIGKKETEQDIVLAQLQSIAKKAEQLGHRDWLIIDEAHKVPGFSESIPKEEQVGTNNKSQYATLIKTLRSRNPKLRVIGLTATPERSGMQCLAGKHEPYGRVFTHIAHETKVSTLLSGGYLSRLVFPKTASEIDLTDIRKSAGEYNQKDLAERAFKITSQALEETMERARDRNHWLVFCVNKEHCAYVEKWLEGRGVQSKVITESTHATDRKQWIEDFKNKNIRCLVSCDLFTEGFDAPLVDCLIILRATMVRSRYVQIMGRGMRIAEGKKDCLCLDYATNVERFGLVEQDFNWGYGKDKVKSKGEAPVRVCSNCEIIVPAMQRKCEYCGHEIEFRKPNLEKNLTTEVFTEESKSQTYNVFMPPSFDKTESKSGNRMFKVVFSNMVDNFPLYVLLDVPSLRRRSLRILGVPDIQDEQVLIDQIKDVARKITKVEVVKEGKYRNIVGVMR